VADKDYLSSNLASVAQRYPQLSQKLESLADSEQINVTESASGTPTAVVKMPDGKEKRLYSRRDPRRDAAQWAESLEIPPATTVALLGVGLGYQLEELLRLHKDKLSGVWCFEHSFEMFREMLRWRDWRKVIEDPTVEMLVGVTEAEFRSEAASSFQQIIVNGLEIIEYGPSVELDPNWYQQRAENIGDLVRQWTAEMITVMERGKLFQTNMLRNLATVADSYLLRDVGESLRGKPAILVSAGPSLDKNAHLLTQAKGMIPIISVDTSLRILQKHGVVPDAAVSIDALGMSTRHFEGVDGLEGIPLLYDLEITPDVVGSYSGPRILIGNQKPQFYSWLEEVTGPLEGLTKGLTVAQAAFLVLAHSGASPIILVGQDLSFEREGGRTHAEGAAFQGRFEPGEGEKGKWEDPLKPEGLHDVHILQVPANDGGTVPTTYALFAYLKRLEDDIAATGANVINATAGGARIAGTQVADLEGVLTEYLPAAKPFAGLLRGCVKSLYPGQTSAH